MYRVTIQDGVVVSKESMDHLEAILPFVQTGKVVNSQAMLDDLVADVELPATPEFDLNGNLIGMTPIPKRGRGGNQ